MYFYPRANTAAKKKPPQPAPLTHKTRESISAAAISYYILGRL